MGAAAKTLHGFRSALTRVYASNREDSGAGQHGSILTTWLS
jgi:hypothetical protein